MSKFRKKLITVLAVLFCALLALSAAIIIPKNKSADAYSNSSTPDTTVNELYSSTHGFSAANLRTLYGKLVNNATKFADIQKALPDSTSTKSVSDFAAQEIIVEFGGKQWIAVYLSKAKHNLGSIAPDTSKAGYADSEDIVLTLWLASTTQEAKWQDVADLTDDICYNLNGVSKGGKYPANMYGTSYMRTYVLNNGGNYYVSKDSVAGVATQNTSNNFAQFTMSTASNSVVDYLVAPRYISWQYQQNSQNVGSTNRLSNDSWGKTGGQYYLYDYENFQTLKGWDKDYYSMWKDDLVWLPSTYETGLSTNGLWNVTLEGKQTQSGCWLRTASVLDTTQTGGAQTDDGHTKCVFTIGSDGQAGGVHRIAGNQTRLVRPAIHLNLTKAAAAAKGVSYDAVTPTKVEETAEIDKSETDHTFEHVYDGNKVEITLADYKNLDIENNAPYVGDYDYTQTEAKYDKDSGKFTATKPKKDDDETYIIKVTPASGYVWDDNDGSEARYYKIKITLASISNVEWGNPEVSNGGSLLQATSKIKSSTQKNDIIYTEKYYRVEPESSPSTPMPSDWLTNGGWAVQWEDRNETASYFKATKKGTYVVYYEITADYHKIKRGSYTVTLTGSETIELTIKADIPKETFGDTKAADLRSNLIKNLGNYATFTQKSNSKIYEGQDLTDLLIKLEIIVLDKSGTEVELAAGRNYYNVGTYNIHVRYNSTVSAADKTFDFKWKDNEMPTLTVEKREIAVGIIAATAGEKLTHVYGNDKASMKYDIADGAYPDGEKFADLLIDEDVFKIVKADGTLGDVLNNRTAVGSYKITGVASENSNYKVKFDEVSYSVTARPVTVQVADETTEYGTDFSDFEFQAMTRTDGSLASFDTLSNISKNATRYYLLMNGNEIELGSDLTIGEYELCAEITNGNYTFTYISGKLTITKANFDMSGVKLENKGYIYNGEARAAQISGTLPSSEISVSYRYVNMADGSESTEPPTEIGLYLVYASFTHSNDNYNEIGDKVAYIRIAATAEEANQAFPALPTDEEIANAANVAKKKAEAKKTLDEEAKKKKDEIDAKEELTDEEKEAAKKKVDEELAKGNAAIDGATDINGVNQAFNDGKANIEKIKAEHKGESSFPWWIIAVIAGVLVMLTVIIVIVVKRRNSEDEEEDFYDDEYDFDDEEVEEEDYGDDF